MPDLILATTETIAGHRVTRTLGYVDGFGSPTQNKNMRQDIAENAAQMGANAVVALRRIVVPGPPAPLHGMYGTAVVIEPEAG